VQAYHSLDDLRLQNTWLTIGIFDGVHRGHQEILRPLVSGALAAGAPSAVLTFSPHPAVVLGGKLDFKCLTTPDERAGLLGSYGMEVVVTQTFDRALADQTAGEFMQYLYERLGLQRLFIGYDTALGKGREGNAARLTELGMEMGYTVTSIPPLKDENGIISSTRIRAAVAAGKVSEAASDLSRPYSITGPVIHGDGRGRTLDIPTANIKIPADKVLPAYGIYACRAWVKGRSHAAATSIGVRPTFFRDAPPAATIEAHLLDFRDDLYGQEVKLEFVEYLRAEEKYGSITELMRQIGKDIAQTRDIIK
jgi:riboflavin kinase/FMN adenylyltransferase